MNTFLRLVNCLFKIHLLSTEAVEMSAQFFHPAMTFLWTSWIHVLHMCSLGVSQDFEWIWYLVCRNLGIPHCGIFYFGIYCLTLQHLWLAWILIFIFQSNNSLTFFMNCITSVPCKAVGISRGKLGKNWVLNTVNSIFKDFNFYLCTLW